MLWVMSRYIMNSPRNTRNRKEEARLEMLTLK